jgi:hypothetical protein
VPSHFNQRTVIAAAIAACFPGFALGAGVARVDFAVGNVSAIGADGRSRALSKGSEIEVGETVATQQGRAQLRFADGAYMSLQPGTEFKVEEFRYGNSGKPDASDNIVMNLIKGGMRTVTGLIGRTNRANYKLRTDVATIGIRGTEYTVRYTNSIEVFCVDGAIVVQNEGGTLNLNGGQGALVSNFQAPPQRQDQPPVLPPQSGPNRSPEEQVASPTNPVQEALQEITPPAVTLLTGSLTGNWAVTATGSTSTFNGIEQAVSLNDQGALTAFADTFEGPVNTAHGTATPESAGNDGDIAWGRWVNGSTEGDGTLASRDLASQGPLHYVVGVPVTNMPATGIATYSMLGATTPTVTGTSLGTVSVTESALRVDFAVSAVFVDTKWSTAQGVFQTDPNHTTALETTGRFTDTYSPACGQNLRLSGFLSGDGASRAGIAYSFSFAGSTATGAIAYQRGALSLSPPLAQD